MGNNNGRGKRLIHGVGINDVDALTRWNENGKRVDCPIYVSWKDILKRCYNILWKKNHPHYNGVTVHPDWHRFSNFKEWVNTQPQSNWQELQIDKDLLIKGNKVYGPDTCCFLTRVENNLFRSQTSTKMGYASYRTDYHRNKPWVGMILGHKNYKSRTGKTPVVGFFSTKEEAEFVAMRESMPIVIEIANANPHQFIRDAMFRWIDDWKTQLLLLESAFQKNGEKNGTIQDYLC